MTVSLRDLGRHDPATLQNFSIWSSPTDSDPSRMKPTTSKIQINLRAAKPFYIYWLHTSDDSNSWGAQRQASWKNKLFMWQLIENSSSLLSARHAPTPLLRQCTIIKSLHVTKLRGYDAESCIEAKSLSWNSTNLPKRIGHVPRIPIDHLAVIRLSDVQSSAIYD